MKDVSDLPTMINALHTENFYKRMNRFLSIIKVVKELAIEMFKPFERQPHKMVKHTETIRRQQLDHLVRLALKRLKPKALQSLTDIFVVSN